MTDEKFDQILSDYKAFRKAFESEANAFDRARKREDRAKIESELREAKRLCAEADALTYNLKRGF